MSAIWVNPEDGCIRLNQQPRQARKQIAVIVVWRIRRFSALKPVHYIKSPSEIRAVLGQIERKSGEQLT